MSPSLDTSAQRADVLPVPSPELVESLAKPMMAVRPARRLRGSECRQKTASREHSGEKKTSTRTTSIKG